LLGWLCNGSERKGRPGFGDCSLWIIIAGTIAVIALTITGPVLAGIALRFGPPEFFSLMIVGIMVLTFLSSGSMVKALLIAAVGLGASLFDGNCPGFLDVSCVFSA
jgi:putative tricarboxylic transport membrane protein